MTRAMLVTVLYRLEGEPAVAGRSSFADVRSGAYYEKAVIWAVAERLVNGASGKLMPKGYAARAQVAAIFHRFVENVVK